MRTLCHMPIDATIYDLTAKSSQLKKKKRKHSHFWNIKLISAAYEKNILAYGSLSLYYILIYFSSNMCTFNIFFSALLQKLFTTISKLIISTTKLRDRNHFYVNISL